jgi:hypothetical protein
MGNFDIVFKNEYLSVPPILNVLDNYRILPDKLTGGDYAKTKHQIQGNLDQRERETLRKLVKNGKTAGYRIYHAQILLALDEIPTNESRTYRKIAAIYGSTIRSK